MILVIHEWGRKKILGQGANEGMTSRGWEKAHVLIADSLFQ